MLPAAVRNSGMKAKERLYVAPSEGTFELTHRQSEVLEGLRRVGGGWLPALTREFACTPQLLKALADKGAATIEKRQMRRDPLANRKILPSRPLALMDEQAVALEQIFALLNPVEHSAPKPLLLFGVTGSGKTEVYLQAIARMLEQGRGAIVLVPEIALTPQTVQRFAARFGNRIAVLHSALGEGERFDEWHRIRTGEAVVVVGPRSAVFAPVKQLGLIVVDEEHEPSYKQDEAPRYNARDVAVMRGHLEACAVVLGTATPAMETWLNVQKGKYAVAYLTKRVSDRPMPRVHVVDMRIETAQAGHVQIFSGVLLEALKLRLERGEQSILFLNRRGYANALVCPSCGAAASCDACSVSYTYHQADICLRCHICGCWKPVPTVCPACGDPAFKYAGFGTQRVELALHKCFPQAKVLRMDADVTARKHSHDELLGIFKSGRADILIGTQMIAKGLDFPNVTLVGVLSADMSLHMPDFRAGERTYQLLAQVSGRAGRAELPGEVYVQTFSPEHPAVRAAAGDEGFAPFAEQELRERKEGGYPPYTHLLCLTFKGETEEKVRFAAEAYASELAGVTRRPSVQVSEACPAPLAKAKGLYRYQVLLRAVATHTLTRPLREVMRQKPLPQGVTLAVDVDALSIM
jgi:primosomal protein N' (replication factor Y)